MLFRRCGRSLGFKLVDHGFDIGNRDCVTHAFHAGGGQLSGIDADDLAVHIEQCAAAVAWIDCRIGLQVGCRDSLAGAVGSGLHRAVECADDTGRHGLSIAECIANGDYLLTDPQLGRITECCYGDLTARAGRKRAERHLDDGNVLSRIDAAQLCFVHLIVNKTDRKRRCALYHMVVCDDIQGIQGFLKDNAGADAGRFLEFGAIVSVAVEAVKILLGLLH